MRDHESSEPPKSPEPGVAEPRPDASRASASSGTGDTAAGEQQREQKSILAVPERRVLDWLMPKLPRWVTPDLLTGGALVSMIVAGLAYARAAEHPWLLHVVNFCLFLHWFGDSLDGGLARYRNQSRPRYGFYVDHMADVLGASAVALGAAVSGVMTSWVAGLILISFLLLSIHSYLVTVVLGVFHLSFGRVGPTELRLVMGVCNLFVLWSPTVVLAGRKLHTFDVVGGVAVAALIGITVMQVARTTAHLYRLETVWRKRAGKESEKPLAE